MRIKYYVQSALLQTGLGGILHYLLTKDDAMRFQWQAILCQWWQIKTIHKS